MATGNTNNHMSASNGFPDLPPATCSVKTISIEEFAELEQHFQLLDLREKKRNERLARKQKKADQYIDGEYAPWNTN